MKHGLVREHFGNGADGELVPMAELLKRALSKQVVILGSVRITEYFDPFGGTSKERVARKYGVRGVNVTR